ncbi:GNAT family N-acetyltransferase [Actinokineospora inagensis]|uniref:GNAT family N-acetyltransferase n=1 Tax=Actinokineospora inagensis TaxID=103730 RepID=UPI000406114F|nr:GNAT family N-acetyltransferase [Actinokineospora inagensis]
MTQHDLVLRPITGPDELDLFTTLPYVLNAELANDLAVGRRRPEWLWVALRGGGLVARAGWWSRPGHAQPEVMDFLDFTDDPGGVDDAVRLVEAALPTVVPDGTPPEFTRFLPPDWRADAESVNRRIAALERLGAGLFVERLRLQWDPGTAIPPLTGRLAIRPVRDPDELITLMTLVLDGTLDAHSRDDLTALTPVEAARAQYHDELKQYPGSHDWWRVATLHSGEPVGFVLPSHNGYNHIIAYIGVVPAHRGHGHIHDLLATGTAILAAQDAPRVRAATDVGNTPMAAAFAHAGYAVFQRQIDLRW